MTDAPRILAFAGATRAGSFNKMAVAIAARGAEAAGAKVTLIDLADLKLPLYDGDLEAAEGLPAGGRVFRDHLLAHDGLLIACPEYNGSITAVLKNAIDWASRPVDGEPQPFAGKVVGLVAASPGGLGGLRGLVHVRQILSNLNALVIPEQRAVGGVMNLFDAEGRISDDATREGLEAVGRRLVEICGPLTQDA